MRAQIAAWSRLRSTRVMESAAESCGRIARQFSRLFVALRHSAAQYLITAFWADFCAISPHIELLWIQDVFEAFQHWWCRSNCRCRRFLCGADGRLCQQQRE